MTGPVLLAVAHGTSDRAGIAVLDALVERVRVLAPGTDARLAYVDHEPPSVSAALAGLAAEGRPTVVVPLLLTAAAHSKGDVAGALRLARAAHPGWSGAYARPLGAHPLLLSALAARLTEAGAGRSTAVVVATAGSADPDANAEVARLARLLWEWRGGEVPVEYAYASTARPTVAEAVDRLRRLGHDDVAVARCFLAPGRLPDAVARAAGSVVVTEVLGAHDDVARLVLERWAEAGSGVPLRMNCDVCRYRTPWPGAEQHVGEPQRPHSHPADL